MSFGWLKHAFRALIVMHLVGGVGVMVAVVLASEMTIGGGQFDRVMGYVEETDFKWWVLGLVFGAWLLPLLVVPQPFSRHSKPDTGWTSCAACSMRLRCR
jgi:hypothetical protein